jgi:uncharacterized protein (DUF433 family)
MEQGAIITRDEQILGGLPVFAGTRVPVRTLLDYLEQGHSLDTFLDDFPTVQRGQAQQVLSLLKQRLIEQIAT